MIVAVEHRGRKGVIPEDGEITRTEEIRPIQDVRDKSFIIPKGSLICESRSGKKIVNCQTSAKISAD
jgi:hypothetical protein